MCSESQAQIAYRKKRLRRARGVRAAQWGILVAVLIAWEILARLEILDAFLLSSPSRMVQTFVKLCAAGEMQRHLMTTLSETLMGFCVGSALGIALAAALWWFPIVSRVLDPYLVVINALPKIALGPVLIVWIGAGMPAIVVMTLLISVIVTLVTVLGGFEAVEEEKLTLLRAFGASKWQCFTRAVFPGALPTTVSALKIGIGMSWVGVIVGEFLVSRAGLGYLIVYGGQVFKLDLVMTSTLVLCACAALMYAGVSACERRLNLSRMRR